MNDDWEYSEKSCKKCFSSMARRDCWNCGGEGGFGGDELMEEDPLWYDEDDYETCSECRGRGYFEWCPECAKQRQTV